MLAIICQNIELAKILLTCWSTLGASSQYINHHLEYKSNYENPHQMKYKQSKNYSNIIISCTSHRKYRKNIWHINTR